MPSTVQACREDLTKDNKLYRWFSLQRFAHIRWESGMDYFETGCYLVFAQRSIKSAGSINGSTSKWSQTKTAQLSNEVKQWNQTLLFCEDTSARGTSKINMAGASAIGVPNTSPNSSTSKVEPNAHLTIRNNMKQMNAQKVAAVHWTVKGSSKARVWFRNVSEYALQILRFAQCSR